MAIALFALWPCVACKPTAPTAAPTRVERATDRSAVLPAANDLVDAMAAGDVARVRARMTG
jgi:hypothetical protein